MPSDPAQEATAQDPPPAAANVATAYPPDAMRSSLPKLLSIVTFLGAILVLIVHRVDHPATNAVKSAFNDAVSSATGKIASSETTSSLPSSDRLAVCFSGHVGTLQSVYKQNLEAIRKVDPSAAIFYYLDLYDDYHHERTNENFKKEHDIGSLQPIFDAAKAVAVKTYTAADVILPAQSVCHKKEEMTRAHYSHNFMQFYAAAGCYEMIKQAESDVGKKFGWILHLQPNMNIAVRLPPADVKPRVHLSGSAMALMPRHLADSYFSVIDAFSDGRCKPLDDMGVEPCKNYSYDEDSTECLLIKWLKKDDNVPSNGVYVNRRIVYPEGADVEK